MIVRVLSLAGLLLASAAASAHPGHADVALRDGFLHPWLGWDHLLAMIAVGIWAWQSQRGQGVWRLPAAFVAAVAVGALAGQTWGDSVLVEWSIAASLIVVGGLIAMAVRGATLPSMLLVALMGLAHGWAHGAGLSAEPASLAFVGGLLVATALLHAIGVGFAAFLLGRGATGSLRFAGAWVAAAGCGLLIV